MAMPTVRNTGIGRSTPSGCRGFIQFLLGNPLLLLSAALGIALVVAGISLKVQTARVASAQEATAKVKGEFAAFVASAKAAAEKQRIETEMIVAHHKEVTRATSARYELRLTALTRSLRERPPVRPDSSPVPITACPAPGINAAGVELVPLEEYRALEARAAQDALTLTELQRWVRETR